jgi:small subunit ribosomal protein S20
LTQAIESAIIVGLPESIVRRLLCQRSNPADTPDTSGFPVANIKSAKKRAKQTVVRNERNVAQRSQLRTAVKKVIKALDAHDATAAAEAFATAQPLLDRFAARGLIHKNKAARHKARLNARIKAIKAA